MMCDETPKIEKCIICSKHCECEAESESFSTEDFEQYRNNPNVITIKNRRKYKFIDET